MKSWDTGNLVSVLGVGFTIETWILYFIQGMSTALAYFLLVSFVLVVIGALVTFTNRNL